MIHNKALIILIVIAAGLFSGCEDYLDAKPEQSLAVPSKLQDLQALMDYSLWMINCTPAGGDIASDYYFLTDADWGTLQDRRRQAYLWDPETDYDDDWQSAYTTVFYANVVLDHVDDAQTGNLNESDRGDIKGQAFFNRGWTFYHLSQVYSPVYSKKAAENSLGIPLRISPDINDETERASLGATFKQILNDLKASAALLPATTLVPTRPSKAAAYAAIARTYLVMGDFGLAGLYADSCLKLQSQLIDYNEIDTNAAYPFETFNEEVILHRIISSSMPSSQLMKVDTSLFALYSPNDIRRSAFFEKNEDGSYLFKGDYGGGLYTRNLFGGISTSEVYLIRAECHARLGALTEAVADINTLRKNRFLKDGYTEFQSTDGEEILRTILQIRRKELAFRGGISWPDLRRLNTDPRFERTISRIIDGKFYELKPNDLRYTYLIPTEVVDMTGIQQNKR